jgi:hypothetical protein
MMSECVLSNDANNEGRFVVFSQALAECNDIHTLFVDDYGLEVTPSTYYQYLSDSSIHQHLTQRIQCRMYRNKMANQNDCITEGYLVLSSERSELEWYLTESSQAPDHRFFLR